MTDSTQTTDATVRKYKKNERFSDTLDIENSYSIKKIPFSWHFYSDNERHCQNCQKKTFTSKFLFFKFCKQKHPV